MCRKTNRRLTVAILVRQFPNIVQTYVLNHILSLKKAGARTIIIAKSNPNQPDIDPRVSDYELIKDTVYINTDKTGILKQVLSTPLYKPRYLSAIARIIFSSLWKVYGPRYAIKAILSAKSLSICDFDIVHSHTLFSSYEYLYLGFIFHIPMITTFHGFEPKGSKSLEVKKIHKVLEHTDAFMVNTRFARKQLTDLGCRSSKINIIPQGTNITDFSYEPRSISKNCLVIIISVGRLSIEKGFHIGIKAIARIHKHHPNLEYRIIGGGPEKENLSNLIIDLGLQQTVKLCGHASTSELQSHYSEAHIFVLPSVNFMDGSHTETQGVVLQEAQSSGIPVIASRTGGIPEVIEDGSTGLLFEEENDEQLSYLIESLVNNNELYQALSLQGRKDVEDNFSIEVVYRQQLKIYEKILREAQRIQPGE